MVIYINDSYSQAGFSIHIFNPEADYELPVEYRDNINEEFSYGIEARVNKQIKDGMHLRFSVGYTKINEGRERIFGENQKTLIINKQNKLHLAPGIIWEKHTDKFFFFGGFEIPVNFHGEYRRSLHTYYYNEMLEGWEKLDDDQLIYSSGISLGIAPVFGFRHFFSNNFSVNAEFSNSLLYRNLGGAVTQFDNSLVQVQFRDESKGFTFFNQKISFGVGFWIWKEKEKS